MSIKNERVERPDDANEDYLKQLRKMAQKGPSARARLLARASLKMRAKLDKQAKEN